MFLSTISARSQMFSAKSEHDPPRGKPTDEHDADSQRLEAGSNRTSESSRCILTWSVGSDSEGTHVGVVDGDLAPVLVEEGLDVGLQRRYDGCAQLLALGRAAYWVKVVVREAA